MLLAYIMVLHVLHYHDRLQENEKLILTPFERNLDFWRQLWRVIERRYHVYTSYCMYTLSSTPILVSSDCIPLVTVLLECFTVFVYGAAHPCQFTCLIVIS